MPACIEQVELGMRGVKSQTAVIIHDIEGLLTLVQFGVLEVHTWSCRVDRPDRPDMMVFDLDPDSSLPFSRTCEAAKLIQAILYDVGLASFVKTSGGKGLHILVPIKRRSTWTDVGKFCDGIRHDLVNRFARHFTTSPSQKSRKGKIYIDTLRNRFGATTIAVYSSRAQDGAVVSVPLGWQEIDTFPSANNITVQNAVARLVALPHDPWHEIHGVNQTLTKPMIRRYHNQ